MNTLPFANLTEAMGTIWYQHARPTFDGTMDKRWDVQPGNPCTVISDLTGISRRRLVRWTKTGIPEEAADQIACALGLHVSLIWPSWFPDDAPKQAEWHGPYGLKV